MGASDWTDKLDVVCENCGFKFFLFFHLSSTYRGDMDKLTGKLLFDDK